MKEKNDRNLNRDDWDEEAMSNFVGLLNLLLSEDIKRFPDKYKRNKNYEQRKNNDGQGLD